MGKDRWPRGHRGENRRGGFGAFGRGSYGRGRGGSRGRGFGAFYDGNRYNSDSQWLNRPKRDTPGKRLTEDQIGVTEYMSDHEGFNGIIKSRYSDFQVSEINEQGEVATLTTMEHPELPAEEEVEEDEELLLSKYNVEILPMETWDQINKVALGTASEPVEIDVSNSTKEERTKIHDAVKKAFGESIVGSTVNTNDKKIMRFEKYKKGVRIDNRVKWTWPAEYVYFVVHKENCDTMDAAVRIAERLRMHIKPSMLGYAGTKDRRAKTSQWFSLRKVDPRKIAAACKDLRDIYVGDYSFHDTNLKLGMLKGNKFRIALRNVTASDSVVETACQRLKERGFINYYGLQRFGTRVEVPTFEIGLKLLKGNYKEAVDSILQEREGPLRRALQLYRARGAAAAEPALPRRAAPHAEACLVHALAANPNDYLTAVMKIPRNTRLLYLHSYQSLLWNKCVSERIRRRGLRLAPGDLVRLGPARRAEESEVEESDSEENQDDSDKLSDKTDNTTNDKKTSDEKPANNKKQKKEKQKIPVKVLTQEDVDSDRYTIYDIVMPLPGYLVDYPPNMKDYYETLLKNDGLTLELKHKNKSFSMSGAYRAVCVRAEDVRWRSAAYTAPHADLLLSDLDAVRGRALPHLPHDGKYKALLLTFSLPPSCYATMALRELLKVDTSSDTQAAQNNYHKRKLSESTEDNNEDGKRAKENSKEEERVEEDSEEKKSVAENSEEEIGANNEGEDEIS